MDLLVSIKKKFKDFTLSVDIESHGDALGLLGASGSGKSMTLRCIAGVETPDQGYIRLNGRVLFDSEKGINIPPRNRNIGLLFQSYALFPHMTVNENIMIGMKDKARCSKKLSRLLSVFSLEKLKDRYPWQLSGGQQQRVAMARLFAYEPELLLLDEPFSALDSHLKEELIPELKMILADFGRDLILVSHSQGELYRFCDYLAVLEQGTVVEYGRKEQIFTYPQWAVTARLIGCSNISEAKRLGEYELMALDWDLRLRTAQRVTEEIRYVGVFASQLRQAWCAGENTIPVELVELMEGPKELNLFYQRSGMQDKRRKLHLTLPKDKLDGRVISRNLYLHFPKDNLLLLK